MALLTFLARRIARLVISLLIVSMLAFGLLQLAPGTFAGIQAVGGGSTGLANQQTSGNNSALVQAYGENVPIPVQYWNWLSHAVVGDFGPSYKYPQSDVTEIIAQALPVTASLAFFAMVLALAIAIPVGVISAVRRGTWIDNSLMFVSTLGVAIPNYLMAIILVLVFSVGLLAGLL
ncbi:MAG: ABC transporter permease, partial [Microbacterium sp.]|nr:ABC transporter permease [Microbacterium sp.]